MYEIHRAAHFPEAQKFSESIRVASDPVRDSRPSQSVDHSFCNTRDQDVPPRSQVQLRKDPT